jgi:hypothetical protein
MLSYSQMKTPNVIIHADDNINVIIEWKSAKENPQITSCFRRLMVFLNTFTLLPLSSFIALKTDECYITLCSFYNVNSLGLFQMLGSLSRTKSGDVVPEK